MAPSMAVVVLNWNSGYRLRSCLQSIIDQDHAFDDVIVVDNGSSDGSLTAANKELDACRATVIQLPENMGYGGGMNAGLAATSAAYVIPMNCDCVLRRDFVGQAREILRKEGPSVGILGGIVYRVPSIDAMSPATIVGLDSGRMRVALDMRVSFRPEDDEKAVTKVTGACPILSRAALDRLVTFGFDASYFAYGEDIDLCLRILRSGYRIVYSSELVALHERSYGMQRGVRDRSGVWRRFSLLNRYRNALRHAPKRWLPASLLVIAVEDVAFVASRVLRREGSAVADLTSAWRTVATEWREQLKVGRDLQHPLVRRSDYDVRPRRDTFWQFRPLSLEAVGWFAQ